MLANRPQANMFAGQNGFQLVVVVIVVGNLNFGSTRHLTLGRTTAKTENRQQAAVSADANGHRFIIPRE